jgi:hypothetical protein
MESNGQDQTVGKAIENAQKALRRAYSEARESRKGQEARRSTAGLPIDRYLESYTGLGSTYFGVWSTTLESSLSATFSLQQSGIQTWRAFIDCLSVINNAWFDQAMESVRSGQSATLTLLAPTETRGQRSNS